MAEGGTSKKNEKKLKLFLHKPVTDEEMKKAEKILNDGSKAEGTKKKRNPPVSRKIGRPVTRTDRPERSAAKRTYPGEERYPITLKTERIEKMRQLAKLLGLSIKEVYVSAVEDYILKVEKKLKTHR